MSIVTVTEADQGREIRLRVGDELVLRLPSIPGTGYAWNVSEIGTSVLTSLGAPTLEKTDDRQLLGGPEEQVFRYRVGATGDQKIQLEYRRPWDKAGRAQQIFTATVVVEE